ncbi:Unknown protein [Striga hermonthica]|uniref:Retrotransposon Copia-like N-terminal domain-containing protein n=1 Tax=Striga hermonthica TaxID=68872 RepID=A0A9N7RDM3_STRHE|nr:Unknown protein [Striga hermonthica]
MAPRDNTSKSRQDPYSLHGSDNLGMLIVTNLLTGSNFLPWKRSMMIALGAKTKLGFINGDIKMPDVDDDDYADWKKVDWMVLSWIINSLSKEISESFLYAETVKELWDDICQRFGENNGPMKYKVQREISTLSQGNNTIMEYFNKMKKLWDEYACIAPLQVCDCEKGKGVVQQDAETKLIQFLMGLSDVYDNVRNQIMLIDPLPTVNKAYSMLLTAERQRNIQTEYGSKIDNASMVAKTGFGRGNSFGQARGATEGKGWDSAGRGKGFQRLSREEKARLICEKCGMRGHNTSTCFKIHGIPDWYRDMKGKQGKSYVNAAETAPLKRNKGQKTTYMEVRLHL